MILWISSIISIFLIFKTSNEPTLSIIKDLKLTIFDNFQTGNSIIFNLASGFLVSVIFYILLIWYPERKRKKLIKKNINKQYESFQHMMIYHLLSACNETFLNTQEMDKLRNQTKFKEFFKSDSTEYDDKWYCVINGLDEIILKDILIELEILRNEILYVLNNIDIDNEDVYNFFKQLTIEVYRFKDSSLEYDDVKQLSRFLWSIFTGWSFMDGYRKDDIILTMIKSI